MEPLIFKQIKETKNTVVFGEIEVEGATKIGTLYLQKPAFTELGSPQELTVTVEAQAAA